MPRIFDNIALHLLPDLKQALQTAYRADFCVDYFNLWGWKGIDALVDGWERGEGHCVRLFVGMSDCYKMNCAHTTRSFSQMMNWITKPDCV
jgi:hypothetical protein